MIGIAALFAGVSTTYALAIDKSLAEARMQAAFLAHLHAGRALQMAGPPSKPTCPNCGAPKAEHICAYCKT